MRLKKYKIRRQNCQTFLVNFYLRTLEFLGNIPHFCRREDPRSHLPSVHSVQEVLFIKELGRRVGWFGEDQGVFLGDTDPQLSFQRYQRSSSISSIET